YGVGALGAGAGELAGPVVEAVIVVGPAWSFWNMAVTTVPGTPTSLRSTMSSEVRLKAFGEFVTNASITLSSTPAWASFTSSVADAESFTFEGTALGVETIWPGAFSSS